MAVIGRGLLRCVALAGSALALSACATLAEAPPASGYDVLTAKAQVYVDAGQVDEAVATLRTAATLEPARTQPWQRIARLRFDSGDHALAMAAAQEVLQRDPADQEANDLLVASGLQIAIDTLERLRTAGDAQIETRRARVDALAALLVQVVGADSLLSDELKARLGRQAIEQWKQAHADDADSLQPPEQRSSPLDVLGGD